MAKVFGPLLSVDAKGKIGKGIAFQNRPSGSAIMRNPVPSRKSLDEPSGPKCNQRAIIGLLTAQWQCMTQVQKDWWKTEAGKMPGNLSGYHAFMKKAPTCLRAWHGLVGYWSMNEGSGNIVKDLSGQGNHGELKPSPPGNAPQFVESKNAQFYKALSFDGIDDYVEVADDASLDITDAITIEAWVKRGVGEIVADIVVKEVTLYHLGIVPIGGTARVQGAIMGTLRSKSTDVIPENEWTHIVMKYIATDTQIRLYMNGVEVNYAVVNATNGALIGTSALPLIIGKIKYEGYFEGLIDEVRIYNRALGPEEIKKHYQLMNP